MAKRERNKRAARKARQEERARKEAAQAAAAPAKAESSRSPFKGKSGDDSKAASKKAIATADRKGLAVVTGYFGDVRSEMRKVTWPTANELRSYSVAVIVTLVVLGVILWLVDTGFVAGLVQYTSLRG